MPYKVSGHTVVGGDTKQSTYTIQYFERLEDAQAFAQSLSMLPGARITYIREDDDDA